MPQDATSPVLQKSDYVPNLHKLCSKGITAQAGELARVNFFELVLFASFHFLAVGAL